MVVTKKEKKIKMKHPADIKEQCTVCGNMHSLSDGCPETTEENDWDGYDDEYWDAVDNEYWDNRGYR